MYPLLDTAIKTALDGNTEPELVDVKAFFIGDKQMQTAAERIVIANINDEINDPGNDFDDRKISYTLSLQIKETKNYLDALNRLKEISTAVKKVLRKSTALEDYSPYMTIQAVTPYYSETDYILKTAHMEVYFLVEEDYEDELTELDSIKIRGDVN